MAASNYILKKICSLQQWMSMQKGQNVQTEGRTPPFYSTLNYLSVQSILMQKWVILAGNAIVSGRKPKCLYCMCTVKAIEVECFVPKQRANLTFLSPHSNANHLSFQDESKFWIEEQRQNCMQRRSCIKQESR